MIFRNKIALLVVEKVIFISFFIYNLGNSIDINLIEAFPVSVNFNGIILAFNILLYIQFFLHMKGSDYKITQWAPLLAIDKIFLFGFLETVIITELILVYYNKKESSQRQILALLTGVLLASILILGKGEYLFLAPYIYGFYIGIKLINLILGQGGIPYFFILSLAPLLSLTENEMFYLSDGQLFVLLLVWLGLSSREFKRSGFPRYDFYLGCFIIFSQGPGQTTGFFFLLLLFCYSALTPFVEPNLNIVNKAQLSIKNQLIRSLLVSFFCYLYFKSIPFSISACLVLALTEQIKDSVSLKHLINKERASKSLKSLITVNGYFSFSVLFIIAVFLSFSSEFEHKGGLLLFLGITFFQLALYKIGDFFEKLQNILGVRLFSNEIVEMKPFALSSQASKTGLIKLLSSQLAMIPEDFFSWVGITLNRIPFESKPTRLVFTLVFLMVLISVFIYE